MLAGFSFTASAQTTQKKTTKKTTTTKEAKTTKPAPLKLNPRKIYQWENGQRSTPSGREATPTNGGYTSLKNDTGVLVKKDTSVVKQKVDQ